MSNCPECSSSKKLLKTVINPYASWECPDCEQPVAYSKSGVFLGQVIPLTIFAGAMAALGPSYWYLVVPCYLLGTVLIYFFAPLQGMVKA